MFSPLFKETASEKSAAVQGDGRGVRGSSAARTRREPGLPTAPAAAAQVLRGPARPRAPLPSSRSPPPLSVPLRSPPAGAGAAGRDHGP